MAREGELGHIPVGCVVNFEKNPEGGTESVACKGELAKSSYIRLEPGGLYIQSTGVKQEVKSHNISNPPGMIQVRIPGRIQLDHQLYQSHSSIVKVLIAHQD